MLVRDLSVQLLNRFGTLGEMDTVLTVADMLTNSRLGLVIICGPDERASGVVSKSDLVRHLARAGHANLPVTEVMTRKVVTTSPAANLHETWQYMVRQGLQNLPVVESDGKPLGTLDIRDALSAILKHEEQQEEELISYIAGNGYH